MYIQFSGYQTFVLLYDLVLDPDPRKIEKEGLVNRAGWKCTLRNVRNFINCGTFRSQ